MNQDGTAALGEMVADTPGRTDWTDRLIHGALVGAAAHPPWLARSYACFREQVLHPAYPCFFGTQAEHRGEMFYTIVPANKPRALVQSLATFVRLGEEPRYLRFNLAAFYEPVDLPANHAALTAWFWRELRMLHDADDAHDRDGPFLQPDHPEWEFCYRGCQMFVVVGSPTYQKRRSRRLGPGIVLLFQPRAVFIDTMTNKQISAGVRDHIRRRLSAWDGMATHPDLGFYGSEANREWKQYCLPDDEAPVTGQCPFLTRMAVRS